MSKRLQEPQHSPYVSDGIQHGQPEWKIGGRLIRCNSSYFDEYLSRTGQLHGHFRWLNSRAIRHGEISRHLDAYYCAVLSKFILKTEFCEGSRGSDAPEGNHRGNTLDTAADSDKLSMLICIFETADDSEVVAIRFAPQMIRMRPYDTFPSFRLRPLMAVSKFFRLSASLTT